MFVSLIIFSLAAIVVGEDSVTYPGIGTFHRDDFFDPVHRPINFLPKNNLNPSFFLYTRKNNADPQTLKYNQVESVKKSSFNASLNTKIIVHGFLDNKLFGQWMEQMKDAFLENYDVNVIIVDWSDGNSLPYGQAVANTRVVGPMIAILIKTIGEAAGGFHPENFHILGHSLGAHIAGYAGKFLNGSLRHITGLDPAGPYFNSITPLGRLWPTDAQFVEAIHTDAQSLIPNLGFGSKENCGVVDLYPNGGEGHQPGCNEERVISIITGGITEAARRLVACNHQRAVDFYLSSLRHSNPAPKGYLCDNYDDFKAGKCIDCGVNGEKCVILGPRTEEWRKSVGNNLGSGGKRFFLITDGEEPFFKYQYAIRIKMADGHSEEHGKINLEVSDLHGNTENFEFNPKDEIFKPSQTYSGIFLFKSDLNDVHRIGFEWTKSLINIIFKHSLYIESIEFIPLTQADAKMNPTVVKLCPPNHDGIKNNDKVYFSANC